ncbi:monovalent cation/H+ antiporter complex subunit F [Ornithinimicrobium cerasi]|uniref:Multisubunit Na+/H+ antiporter, MnhF subunit n=1 Tax=Ornithinimicrobium cerasi TaxID=2248773 RepID=A0A285VUL2_9MICO|nr:Multisubunit Na+/H+ antiporter, MnhF subunit [Ornithinimicrobium cerasi]
MNLDLLEQVLEGVVGGLLALSALLTLIRITIGPSVLDRVVATDVLVSIVVCALGAHAALTSGSTTLPLLISLSLVGFMGSVAVARFVARDRDPESGEEAGSVPGSPDRTDWPRSSAGRSGRTGISRAVWEPGVRQPGGRGATAQDPHGVTRGDPRDPRDPRNPGNPGDPCDPRNPRNPRDPLGGTS